MRRLLVLILILGACLTEAAAPVAQGYLTFNGRNHPEIDWRVAETKHFEIIYPARLAGIEADAAPIAEAGLDSLQALFGEITVPGKIRLYLADVDEIANGLAVDVGSTGYTAIWVHANDYAETWTGDVKWLRKVIAHEIAHIVHYRAVRSNVGLWQNLLANPMPSFWAEGMAQYATEQWDAQRGDRWLRMAVFEDRLSTSDGAPSNGRLRYALGNSQVRYLAETYGDSTITTILAERQPALLGLARVHDFYRSFKDATGESYRTFTDEWRKHVNVYYNTLAGQMERLDSLSTDPLSLPGQVVDDVQFSPDTQRVAAVVLTSVERPVKRLYVMNAAGRRADSLSATRDVRVLAEGAIKSPVAWSPSGDRIAYARLHRGAAGSLVNDLYLVTVDSGERRRLTTDRRAVSPTFAPDGRRLAFVASEGETANLFVMDLETGEEARLTNYTGDVQITSARWGPDGRRLAVAVFDGAGRRDLVLADAATGEITRLPTGDAVPAATRDDRGPVWRPDGRAIAFTSLRDGVPNVFTVPVPESVSGEAGDPPGSAEAPIVTAFHFRGPVPAPRSDAAQGEEETPAAEERVTYLFTGAAVRDWLPPDSARAAGRLVLVSSETKRRDRVFIVDAARRPTVTPTLPLDSIRVPAGYAAWTEHRPPATVPTVIPPDGSLIQSRRSYNSLANLTHGITLPLPYADPEQNDYGAFATSLWLEPLGKHALFVLGGLSVTRFVDKSFLLLEYRNRTLTPTLTTTLYRFPSPSSFYGDRLLVENLTGGDVSAEWPLDLIDEPFRTTLAGVRLRLAYAEPYELDAFARDDEVDVAGGPLPLPEEGFRADVQVGGAYKFQRPYVDNVIYPLDGTGARARLTVGIPINEQNRFARPDVQAYHVTRPLGPGRFYVMGRATARFGQQLAQDYVGLAKYDDVDVQVPLFGALTLDEAERVRGYRRYAVGTRSLFGTVEYRLAPLFDLSTTLLGVVKLGKVSPALFADGGLVWTGSNVSDGVRRLGVGAEVKNVLSVGPFEVLQSVGVGVPEDRLGDLWEGTITEDEVDLYYRVQAAIPF